MKKLLAVVLAVIMCTAALLTCVSAEEVAAGTEFNISKKDKSGAFSYGFIDGKELDISKYAEFTDSEVDPAGITADGMSTGMANVYYNGTKPTAFGWGNPEGTKALFVGQMGAAQCFASYVNSKVIKFTAPVDGVYTMTATSLSFWEGCVATSVNGAEFVVGDINKASPPNFDAVDHTRTFSLKAGEAFYIALYRKGTSTNEKDCITMQLKDLVIKLDKLGYEAPETPETPDETKPVYDFVAAFGKKDLTDSCFSIKANHSEYGMQETTTKWYDGTDDSVKNEATGGALTGFSAANEAGDRVDISLVGSDIVYYPRANLENIICFTAPEDGKYTYDFETSAYWPVEHSTLRFYVKAGETVLNEVQYSNVPKLPVADTLTNFEGTVTLKKGQTIFFVVDPEDEASGDNCKLIKLTVTLDEKLDLPDDEPTVEPETPAPDTNDAIVAVIALAAISGAALVISKKR